MIDQDTADLLTLGANVLSAIGTNAAVIVALWLAYHQGKTKMRVRARIVQLVEMGGTPEKSPSYFNISAVNAGAQDVVVNGIQWTLGWVRKKYMVQIPPVDLLNSRLPKKVLPGESAEFYFPVEILQREARRIATAWHGSRLARLRSTRIRVGVYLSTGEYHLTTPAPEVLQMLRSATPLTEEGT